MARKMNPGSGNAQGTGPSHHSYKPTAKSRYRDIPMIECSRCGSKENLCRHHIDRNRLNNTPSNIEILCRSCHSKEHKLHDSFNGKSGTVKLTDSQVLLIREDIRSYRLIAEEYRVTKTTISRIKRRKFWKHLP